MLFEPRLTRTGRGRGPLKTHVLCGRQFVCPWSRARERSRARFKMRRIVLLPDGPHPPFSQPGPTLCDSSKVLLAASEVNRLMYSIRQGVLLYYRKGSGRAVRMEGVDRPEAGRFSAS